MNFDYAQLFSAAIPETVVVITAFLALLVDFIFLRNLPARTRTSLLATVTAVGCLSAIAWMGVSHSTYRLDDAIFVVNPMTQLVKQIILALTIFTAFISVQTNFTRHLGEYFILLLLASAGMMFLVSAENILAIFLALELLSLSLYVLTAFNKQSVFSAEAALKYFLFGGMSAAFTLFGLSLIYGVTGEMNLTAIAAKLAGKTTDPLFYVALVMTVIGFGFKVAAAPFHMWAPDAYQGSPTPVTSFIAAGSKVASFFILAKILFTGFAGAEGDAGWHHYISGWTPVLAILAALSVIIGNLAAISQKSVKRLLAYSAIAHGGYALLGILTADQKGFASLIYYVTTYALTVIGAFGVVAVVENYGGDKLSDFAGLSRRAPILSACMMVFMLSLAGIPPLAGFFGKFYVFTSAIQLGAKSLGLLWLVILAIAMSAVSLYYYLQVLKQIYVVDASDKTTVSVALPTQFVIVALAIAVVVLGCVPNLLVGKILAALSLG
ncbi:MAG: nuoN 2 [Verrucomicrobiales bacterium]|nr:nuoN 2 [Verrucomicrobiales bacterium]